MDLEPIYCSEQIVVPADLADILKAYTKEVIRRQPENLVEFSAKYFKNLSNVASSVQQASAPKLDQLKQFYVRAEGAQQLTPEQVYAVANQLGIAKSIVGKVLAVGRMTDSPGIDVDKFLFLLLVMTCDNFRAVLSQLFSLFGQNIESSRFHLFISYLAPDMDPDITSQFLIDLEQQLGERGAITYEEAVQLPVIQSKL